MKLSILLSFLLFSLVSVVSFSEIGYTADFTLPDSRIAVVVDYFDEKRCSARGRTVSPGVTHLLTSFTIKRLICRRLSQMEFGGLFKAILERVSRQTL